MTQKYFQHGINEITNGQEKEKLGEFQQAFLHFEKGLEWFQLYVKYEQNTAAKQKIQQRMLEYAKHAVKLKQKISSSCDMSTLDDSSKLKASLNSVVLKEKPNVHWDDVVGLEDVKCILKQTITLPLKFPNMFKECNIEPWKGVLMYGPPGNGKTFIAKAVATESNATFFNVRSSDLISKYVGESARLIKELFEMARQEQPSIIFIDEIDSLCSSRDGNNNNSDGNRVQNEFLTQMDGVGTSQSGILVLGATNLPWSLDAAILRRLEKTVYIPLPDYQSRFVFFKKELPHIVKGIKKISTLTEGYSLSDLSKIIKETKMSLLHKVETSTHFKKMDGTDKDFYVPCSPNDVGAIEKNIDSFEEDIVRLPIMTISDVLKSVENVKPCVQKEYLERYKNWK
jgi:vacuolar protein-sorting-associated protein 4